MCNTIFENHSGILIEQTEADFTYIYSSLGLYNYEI